VYAVYGSGTTDTLPASGVRTLANRTVTGSGEFLVNPATGRPKVFEDPAGSTSTRYTLTPGQTEQWYRFSTLGDGLPGNYLRVGPEPYEPAAIAAQAAGTLTPTATGFLADQTGASVRVGGRKAKPAFTSSTFPLCCPSSRIGDSARDAALQLDYTSDLLDFPAAIELDQSAALDSTLYFRADGVLWKTEGTAASTRRVRDASGNGSRTRTT